MIFKFATVFLYISFVKCSLFFHFAIGVTPYLKVGEIENIKKYFQPLKYSRSCEEFCKNITCQPIKECIDGIMLKNQTYCKCCEACVKFLDIGELCVDIMSGSLSIGPQSRCKNGTKCVNGRCKLNLDTTNENCLRHRDVKEKHNAMGNYTTEIWIPQCDYEGHYTAKQIKISRSICVNKSGKKIFGSADDLLKNSCACSRFMEEKSKNDPVSFQVNPQEHCSSAGSFDTLQCINNLCYCADNNTGDVKSELVRIDFLNYLHCYDIKIHGKDYLKECERELQRTKKLTYEFWKKGVEIHGIDRVKCDPDGTFSPLQCLPDRCVCTDKKGIGIREYAAELQNIYMENMTCTCARDEKAATFMSFSCKTNGSYKSRSCSNGECTCVDEDGESIKLKGQKDLDDNSCVMIIENLLKYPKNDSSEDPDYNKHTEP